MAFTFLELSEKLDISSANLDSFETVLKIGNDLELSSKLWKVFKSCVNIWTPPPARNLGNFFTFKKVSKSIWASLHF